MGFIYSLSRVIWIDSKVLGFVAVIGADILVIAIWINS